VKLLVLSGSLRRGGSTEGVLNACVEHLASTFPEVHVEVVHLCDKQVDLCDSCYECDKKRVCWMSDDVSATVGKMMTADGIVYAFPVHAFGVNSLMQAFLERAGVGYLRFSRPLENKPAGIIVTGRRYGHEMAWAQVALNVMLNRMILLGTGFPGVVKNDGKRLGDQIEDAEGLASTKDMLTRMVWFLMERAGHRRLSLLPAAE
jgi:multimeric flavodoxin WrbA